MNVNESKQGTGLGSWFVPPLRKPGLLSLPSGRLYLELLPLLTVLRNFAGVVHRLREPAIKIDHHPERCREFPCSRRGASWWVAPVK